MKKLYKVSSYILLHLLHQDLIRNSKCWCYLAFSEKKKYLNEVFNYVQRWRKLKQSFSISLIFCNHLAYYGDILKKKGIQKSYFELKHKTDFWSINITHFSFLLKHSASSLTFTSAIIYAIFCLSWKYSLK